MLYQMSLITINSLAASAEHTTTGQPQARERHLGSRAVTSDQFSPTATAAIKVGDQHGWALGK